MAWLPAVMREKESLLQMSEDRADASNGSVSALAFPQFFVSRLG